MSTGIKEQIHRLIDQCDNVRVLEEAKDSDWWDELSEEDKNLVMGSEEQYGKADFISHEELIKRFKEWKKK